MSDLIDQDIPTEESVNMYNKVMKALKIGSNADPSTFQGGEVFRVQNLEHMALDGFYDNIRDYKVTATVGKAPVTSTVNEFNIEKDTGDLLGFMSVSEGGASPETQGERVRKINTIAFLEVFKSQTEVARKVLTTTPGPTAAEKMNGIRSLQREAEYLSFHGNSDVNPVQYDSIQKQIDGDPGPKGFKNILDLDGKKLTDSGSSYFENSIEELNLKIYENGGEATHMYAPPVISDEIQKTMKDRINMRAEASQVANRSGVFGNAPMLEYPTTKGSIYTSDGNGVYAGPDKFFQVRGKITPTPTADRTIATVPTSVTIAASAATGTQRGFKTNELGTYFYRVYAVNTHGIAVPVDPAASITPTVGQIVTITITNALTNKPTGYIITRSALGASDNTDTREMVKIPIGSNATTVHVDDNSELPGAAELILLSMGGERSIRFDELLKTQLFNLYPVTTLVAPFKVINWISMNVRIPWKHGYMKNVGHAGVTNWYTT